MPVPNRFGLAREDDQIEISCLGYRAALKPARVGIMVIVC
jgi:hypothetical protein